MYKKGEKDRVEYFGDMRAVNAFTKMYKEDYDSFDISFLTELEFLDEAAQNLIDMYTTQFTSGNRYKDFLVMPKNYGRNAFTQGWSFPVTLEEFKELKDREAAVKLARSIFESHYGKTPRESFVKLRAHINIPFDELLSLDVTKVDKRFKDILKGRMLRYVKEALDNEEIGIFECSGKDPNDSQTVTLSLTIKNN